MGKPKTSLEKSHSKWSNAKLTLLGFFLALFITGLWISIALIEKQMMTIVYIIGGVSLVGTLVCLFLFHNFKR